MVVSCRTITLWRESAFRIRTWLKQFQLTVFLSPLYPLLSPLINTQSQGAIHTGFIFPTTLSKRITADKITSKKTIFLCNFPNVHTLILRVKPSSWEIHHFEQACSPHVIFKPQFFHQLWWYLKHAAQTHLASASFVLCLLTAGRSQSRSWRTLSLSAVWNCPWGMWDFQKLCYTQTPLTALSRCIYPMALCFLHTSFLSTADQGSLNITKAGMLTAPTQGSLLSSTSPRSLQEMLNCYYSKWLLPLVSTWIWVINSWGMKSSTQKVDCQPGLTQPSP